MLGVRLDPETERALADAARDEGKSKSELVRHWIKQKLKKRAMAEQVLTSPVWQRPLSPEAKQALDRATDAYLAALDAEDGGYDWGPEGPPL